MSVTAVVGAQWGDEGKGRVVDYLADDADLVIRYGGGNNAGHTVVNPHGHFKLHLIPSGIFHPGTRNLLGNGVVINPPALVAELDGLAATGFDGGLRPETFAPQQFLDLFRAASGRVAAGAEDDAGEQQPGGEQGDGL